MPEDLSREQIEALARARGLRVDADAFAAGLNSLVKRLDALARIVPRETPPPRL